MFRLAFSIFCVIAVVLAENQRGRALDSRWFKRCGHAHFCFWTETRCGTTICCPQNRICCDGGNHCCQYNNYGKQNHYVAEACSVPALSSMSSTLLLRIPGEIVLERNRKPWNCEPLKNLEGKIPEKNVVHIRPRTKNAALNIHEPIVK